MAIMINVKMFHENGECFAKSTSCSGWETVEKAIKYIRKNRKTTNRKEITHKKDGYITKTFTIHGEPYTIETTFYDRSLINN